MVRWSEIESDPRYAQRTFNEQQEIKDSWIQKALVPGAQRQGFNQIQTAEIVNNFSSPSVRFEDADTERGMRELEQRFRVGDEEAEGQLKRIVLDATAKQSSLLYSIGARLFGVTREQGLGREDETETVSAYQLYNNPEARKAVAYADYLLQQNDETRREINTAKVLTAVGLSLAEWIAIAIPTTGLSLAGAKALGKGAVALKALVQGGKKASLLRKVAGDLVGQIAHASLTGALMTAKDLTLDVVNENLLENPEAQDVFLRGAQYFGRNFLWDAIANVGLDYMLPQVKGIIRMGKWGKGVSSEALVILKGADTRALRRELVADLIVGRETPPELMRQLPLSDQVRLVSNRTTMNVLRKVPDVSPDEQMVLLAKTQGLSLGEVGGKWHLLDGNGKKDSFDGLIDVQKFLQNRTEYYSNVPLKRMGVSGKLNDGVEGFVPSLQAGGKVDLSKVAKPSFVVSMIKSGDTRSVRAASATLLHMAGSKLDPNKLSVLKKAGKLVFSFNNKAVGNLPINKVSPENIGSILREIVKREGLPVTKLNSQLRRTLGEWGKVLERGEFYKKTNMDGFLKGLNATLSEEEGVFVLRRGESVYGGTTANEAFDDFLNGQVTKEDLGLSLRRNFDLSLDHKANVFRVKDHGEVLAESPSIRELLNENPQYIPKLPGELSPRWNLIDGGQKLGISFKAEGASGDYQHMMNVLSKFKNYTLDGKDTYYDVLGAGMKRGKVSIEEGTQKIKLAFEPTGEVLKFDSPSDARAYIKEGFLDFANLKETASRKGYRLDILANGSYALRGMKKVIIANTDEELLKRLREAPIPDWVRELADVDEEVLKASIGEPTDDFLGEVSDYIPRVPVVDALPEYRIATKANQFLAPIRTALENLIKDGGDVQAIKQFQDFENLRRALEATLMKSRRVLPAVFTDYQGKVMKASKREGLGRYMRMSTEEGKRKVVKAFDLTDEDLGVTETLRRIVYGDDEFQGMFALFKVDPEKWIPEYLPKIRDWFEMEKITGGKIPADGSIQKALDKIFAGRVPEGMDAFFKHTRVTELLDIALENDPLKQLQYYLAVGYREKFLGEQFEKMTGYWLKHPDKKIRQRMFIYMGDMMNISATYQQQLLGEIGEDISKKLFKGGKGGKSFFKWLESSCYLGTMGWRPWLAIRNSHQIWGTLAPLMTNGRTRSALAYLDDHGEEVFKLLKGKGIITESMPFAGRDVLEDTPMLDFLAKSGLRCYKDADSLTRAVAYIASSNSLDDALKKFPGFGDDFMKESRMIVLPKDLQERGLGFLKKGDTEAARDLLGNYVSERTMFPYRSGMSNIMYRGTIGKLFGRMGHYPLYYVDNVRRSLKELPIEEKIAFGATWVANSAILYEGFKKMFGADAKQFLFYNPMMFTGGPYYEVVENIREIAGGGPLAVQKLNKMVGVKGGEWNPLDAQLFKLMVPGGTQMAKMRQGMEELGKGNTWAGVANMLSLPYTPDEAFWE